MLHMTVGERIRVARVARGMGLGDLSLRSGISVAYICQLERNQKLNPSIHVLQALGLALGVPLADLLPDSQPTLPPPPELVPDVVTVVAQAFDELSLAEQEGLARAEIQDRTIFVLRQLTALPTYTHHRLSRILYTTTNQVGNVLCGTESPPLYWALALSHATGIKLSFFMSGQQL